MDVLKQVNVLFALLTCLQIYCDGANILVMLPLPLYSHTNAYMPVIKALAKKGHNITMVSPFPQEKPTMNIKDIVIPKLYHEITDPSMFVLKKRTVLEEMQIFWDFGLRGSEAALKQKPVIEVISAPKDSFQLILTETFFLLEPMAALGYKFSAPIVNLHPWGMTLPIAYFTGNSLPSSYSPSVYTTYSESMTLFQRTKNFFINALELLGLHFYYLPKQDVIMRKYVETLPGFENLPYITHLLRNTSLTLLDAHHALDFNKPYFKNVIEIGGLTVHKRQQVKKDLQKYMDESTRGFIYFSLGSHLPSSMLPEELKENLFKAFKKVKENIIMKWDDEDVSTPANVIIEKWLPQTDVLSHPNCKLFITHGGLHAIQEATYYKIPIVGLPLVADQPINMRFVEYVGLGMKIDIFNSTEDLILSTITTVLTNKSFKEVARERSSLLRDNPINTLDKAVYHIEYLLRHTNSLFQPPSLQRAWFEVLLLDVMLLLHVAILLLIVSIVALLRFIQLNFRKKQNPKVKKS